MKRHATLLPLAAFIAFAAVKTSASTPGPALPGTKTPDSAPQAQFLKPTPAAASATGPANPSHLFTVNDEKGLVLTCIAPEIDINPDTDMFKSCTLAPGRTLDDVMHTFVQGIHYEQSEHQRELEEWQRAMEAKTVLKPAQKH
jgi:inorganic pyrophosphatase